MTIRYASITPIGSFQGSKRDTWQISGRSTSIPNCLQTNAASSGESAMFFGESGSIAGGTMLTLPRRAAGTYCSMCQTSRRTPDQRQHPRQRLGVRRREVDVAAPDPVAGALGRVRAGGAGCGSWTMIASQSSSRLLRVHRVVGLEHLPLLVGDRLLVALERVVHQLGDVEELLAPEDHVPVRVEADVAHQRDQRVEDLRDAAAERGRADVQDAGCPRSGSASSRISSISPRPTRCV